MSNYKGFALFDDVEDAVLRTNNRARVLTNIAEDHTKNSRITPKGAGLILGYFAQIPGDERLAVQQRFTELMKQSGFQLNHA